MYNEKKKISNARSDKRNAKTYLIKLSKNTDADIINLLDSVENRNGFIKSLLRAYLKRGGD